jgi:DNA-binding NarL/FixJ family response regulator
MGNSLKILIADGAALVRERLSLRVSEISRVEVVGQAKDKGEAILLFDLMEPDAVILDVQMPGGGGLDVLRHVKGKRPEVAVVVMTTFPSSIHREASAKGGADFFVDKANDIGEIIRVVNALAGGLPTGGEGEPSQTG